MHATMKSLKTHNPLSFGVLSRKILFLALPIILSQLAQITSAVVDIVMAGSMQDPSVLGAVSVGAAFWTPISVFLLGLLYAVTHQLGALRGMGHEKAIPTLTAKAMIMGLTGGILLGLGLYFAIEPICIWMNVAADVRDGAIVYTQVIAWAFPALGLFFAARFLLEASGGAAFVMLTVVASIIVKIFLNNVLVFGAFGIEPMGVKGFGIASVLVYTFIVVILLCIIFKVKRFRVLWNAPIKAADLGLWQILDFIKKGFPIALNFCSDYVVLSVVTLFIASVSSIATSAHQIAINIITVLLLITSGIAMSGTIMISNAAGENNSLAMRQTILACFTVNMTVALCLSCILWIFGTPIVHFYQASAEISTLAVTLIDVAAMLFSVNVACITLAFIFRGIGQPATPFWVMLVAHWGISIPFGYVFANTSWIVEPLGIVGWWYGLFVGISCASLIFLALLLPKLPKKEYIV